MSDTEKRWWEDPWVEPDQRSRWYHQIHPEPEVQDRLNELTRAGFEMDDPEEVDASSIPGEDRMYLLRGVRTECNCENCKPSRSRRRRGKATNPES